MAKHYAMVIQLKKCLGCQACTVACKFENKVPDGQYRTKSPAIGPSGTYPHVKVFFEKQACQMCQDAPCVKVCPTTASHYNKDGLVLIDSHKCVGCKYCMTACPYDARFINKNTGTADKCTFCYDTRITKGEKPGCVSTCVGGALLFGDANDPQSEVARYLATHRTEVRKARFGTRPSVHYDYEGVK
ncbi:tetrathionate reductase subunit B precursor [Peptococcaceae bacterium CEB3]|nr:tetrathionate reductase subunit B precursor [Peptococcaceae bacterium CEB3]